MSVVVFFVTLLLFVVLRRYFVDASFVAPLYYLDVLLPKFAMVLRD
jgi:hypothetical protein